MLVQLSIQNLVLIERLDVELGPGFNVLTGETGAGKSIVIDALSLVLGGRASADVVRTGAKEAEVSALFEIDVRGAVGRKLEDAGIPCDGQVVIRRIVQAEGRSRAFLNGRPITAAELAAVAAELCDVSSQHESVRLTDPQTHAAFLDAFGKLDGAAARLALDVHALSEVHRELAAMTGAQKGRAEREDYLRFQLKEIEELDPADGEELELSQQKNRLRHAERLSKSTRGASERLYESEGAICDELGRLVGDLESCGELDSSLMAFARTIDEARAELADVARGLARYSGSVESNPGLLEEIEDRLFRLQKLLRKHGPSTNELLAYRKQMQSELENLGGSDERIVVLEAAREKKYAEVAIAARSLSKARRAHAERLADAIGKELAQLGMGRARVVVDVAAVHASADTLQVDGMRLMASGIDRVEFLIAPNPGEEPKPLRRIASGGELSRSLLALKRVLAENGPAGLYVFDEVDAGVSGAIAEVLGRAILDVAQHRQVLCITHLPQIAALADTHFRVDKSEADGRTRTTLTKLSEPERIDEVARMIGGVRVTDSARKAAEEMLLSRKSPVETRQLVSIKNVKTAPKKRAS